MDKVSGGKKDVKKKKERSSDKKKEKKSENKIITAKKMRGSGPFEFNSNLEDYRTFVNHEFQNHKIKIAKHKQN